MKEAEMSGGEWKVAVPVIAAVIVFFYQRIPLMKQWGKRSMDRSKHVLSLTLHWLKCHQKVKPLTHAGNTT